MNRLDELSERLRSALGDTLRELVVAFDEVTIVVGSSEHLAAARTLRDDSTLGFEQLIDLAGVDYSSYGDGAWDGARYAVVMHLLSIGTTGGCASARFARTTICPWCHR